MVPSIEQIRDEINNPEVDENLKDVPHAGFANLKREEQQSKVPIMSPPPPLSQSNASSSNQMQNLVNRVNCLEHIQKETVKHVFANILRRVASTPMSGTDFHWQPPHDLALLRTAHKEIISIVSGVTYIDVTLAYIDGRDAQTRLQTAVDNLQLGRSPKVLAHVDPYTN